MSPGRKPSRSPASTAGRERISRSACPCSSSDDRIADREPGLAGAGGSFGEDELMLLQRLDVIVLRGVAGPHRAALAGGDLVERRQAAGGRLGCREQGALQRAFLDGAVDVAGGQSAALAGALIQPFEHAAGDLGRSRASP